MITKNWTSTLVRDDVAFEWSSEMTEQMEATKRLLCGDVYVHSYDTKLVPTIFAWCWLHIGTARR